MKIKILASFSLLLLGASCTTAETEIPASAPPTATDHGHEHPEPSEGQFVPTGEFELRIDGTPDAQARLFRSSRPPAWLIMAPSLEQSILLKPTSHEVMRLQGEEASRNDDGSLELVGGYETTTAGGFQVRSMPDGSSQVDFKLDGRVVQMVKRANVLGARTVADLQSYDPYYRWKSFQYEPDAELMQAIARVSAPVEVQVFFGSWCPYCKEYVPHLMALERLLAESSVRFSYYGLPRDFSLEPLTSARRIQRVPTAIVASQGKTLGRLVGRECEEPEKKLSQILSKLTP